MGAAENRLPGNGVFTNTRITALSPCLDGKHLRGKGNCTRLCPSTLAILQATAFRARVNPKPPNTTQAVKIIPFSCRFLIRIHLYVSLKRSFFIEAGVRWTLGCLVCKRNLKDHRRRRVPTCNTKDRLLQSLGFMLIGFRAWD